MNRQHLLQILGAGALLMLIQGCGMFARSGPSALVGTWKNSLGTVWTLRADGTFEADLDHDGKRDAWGKYKADKDTVTMWRVGGINPKNCGGKGVYHFSRPEENKLQFSLVRDACKLRRKNILLEWRRK